VSKIKQRAKDRETRILSSKVEIRTETEENTSRIVGYGLRFNSWSEDLGGFIEQIDPRALEGADLTDVRCLIDHDSG